VEPYVFRAAGISRLAWGTALTSVEYQIGEAWNRVLSQFAATDAFAGALSMEEAASLLGCIAAETVFQPEGEEAPVEVLGTLEASGLRFDHLWSRASTTRSGRAHRSRTRFFQSACSANKGCRTALQNGS